MQVDKETKQPPKLALGQIYKQAWLLLKASKWPIWSVYLAYAASVALVIAVGSLFFGDLFSAGSLDSAASLAVQRMILYVEMLMKIILAPLGVGAFMVAILRVRGEKVSAKSGFLYFPRWLDLSLTQLIIVLVQVFIREGTNLFRSAGENNTMVSVIYFVAFFALNFLTVFALPLVADKNLKPWSAIKASVAIAIKHWWQLLAVLASVILLWTLLVLPITLSVFWLVFILLAAVWLIPFSILIFALMYRWLVDRRL